ncbi:MAG: sigma-70 family RNA polymerase sigma factor [Actinomycetota bacterium]|nr:sigma-70 family RNA polymerase sigma factor [Actinomycetota bacterium]
MAGDRSDDGSFEEWYRAEHPRVLGLLIVVAGDVDAGRDATAEAFTRALERWPRVRQMTSPSAWTYRVGVNVVRRRLRRSALEARHWFAAPESSVAVALDTDLWAAVRRLPPRQRTAIALRYVCDLPHAEIAAVMGVTVGTVSATLTAAHRRLAAHLEHLNQPRAAHGGVW